MTRSVLTPPAPPRDKFAEALGAPMEPRARDAGYEGQVGSCGSRVAAPVEQPPGAQARQGASERRRCPAPLVRAA